MNSNFFFKVNFCIQLIIILLIKIINISNFKKIFFIKKTRKNKRRSIKKHERIKYNKQIRDKKRKK